MTGVLSWNASDPLGTKAEKMAGLVKVLHGAGFGDQKWIEFADGLTALSAGEWSETRLPTLIRMAQRARDLSTEVLGEYQKTWNGYLGREAPLRNHLGN